MSCFQGKPEILERIRWLIKLRWMMAGGALIAICVAEILMPSDFLVIPYSIMAVLVICYNLAFSFYSESLSLEYNEKKASKFANLQISVDLFALAFVVYLSGGAESPFIFFFVFHMITAGILLSVRESYMKAALASFVCALMMFLEYKLVIPHWNLAILYPKPLGIYLDGRFLSITVLGLSTSVFLTVYITNYLSGLLRKKQEGIKELSTLLNVGKLLSSTLKLDAILDLILDAAISETGTSAGSIALLDEKKGEFTIRAAKGFSKEFLNKTQKWKVRKGGMTDRILRGGEPLVIEDAAKEEIFNNPVGIKEGIKSLIAIPLFTNDREVGILYVDAFKSRKFTESEVRLTSLLATQAAAAINNAQLHEKTRKLAIIDGLTGIYNYRHFRETLENEIKRANRYHHLLSLIMIDVDNFKKYNDAYGHLEGDILLTKIAYLITKHTRGIDIVARYGGDEFVVISPETDKNQAIEVAERVRIEIVDKFFKKKEVYNKVTLSMGVASFPSDAVCVDDLIRKADIALYKAKRTKRNKVRAFALK